jgi:hypothetical protein
MNLHPYRLLKMALVLFVVVAITMIIGLPVGASPAASHTYSAAMTMGTSGLSGGDLFYMVLGVLDMAAFAAVYRLARQ